MSIDCNVVRPRPLVFRPANNNYYVLLRWTPGVTSLQSNRQSTEYFLLVCTLGPLGNTVVRIAACAWRAEQIVDYHNHLEADQITPCLWLCLAGHHSRLVIRQREKSPPLGTNSGPEGWRLQQPVVPSLCVHCARKYCLDQSVLYYTPN